MFQVIISFPCIFIPRSFTRRCVSYNTMMLGFVYMEGLMRAVRHINCLKKCPRRILFVMWYATLIQVFCNEGKIGESLNLIPRVSDSGLTAISFLLFPKPPPNSAKRRAENLLEIGYLFFFFFGQEDFVQVMRCFSFVCSLACYLDKKRFNSSLSR